ncbi:MAG TPA: OmpA family protein, partial [Spirochaetes bacterium]|nr:OmpA family protein [Spirochaetota bacterium]
VLMNGTVLEFKGIDYGDVRKKSSDPVEIAKIPDKEVDRIEEDIKKKLKDKGLNFPVQKKKKKIIINIGELLFDFDSARLKKENIQQLDKLAKLLMKYDHFRLTVDGHTDAIGKKRANQVLSAKRAKRVRDYLVQKGVSKDKITSRGYGEDQPIDTNSTSEGRARNRRVEITIDLGKK